MFRELIQHITPVKYFGCFSNTQPINQSTPLNTVHSIKCEYNELDQVLF